jgi:hypothetical protein
MTKGSPAKRRSGETESGTGPANPVSPSLSPANENQEDERRPFVPIHFKPVAAELTGRDCLFAELMSSEEEDCPEFEILLAFRRKISGLRKLPRHQRAQEIRVALEWLLSTMKGLREKRLYARHARNIQRQHRQMPRPRW